MKNALFLLLALTFSAIGTHAQEVSDPSLKLVGRGFMNRETGESLAIACVGKPDESDGPSCDTLQFVRFDASGHKAFWVGSQVQINPLLPESKVQTMSDHQKLRYAIKKIMKVLKHSRWVQRGRFQRNITMEVCAGGLIYTAALGVVLIPSVLGAALVFLGVGSIVRGNQDLKIQFSSYNQNGWDWSSKPKMIQAKAFEQILQFLSSNSANFIGH